MALVGSAASVAEVIGAIATPVVAVVAIAANVWTTRRTLNDRREDRLWGDRAQLYLDLVRLVRREQQEDASELWMAADALDHMPTVFWQSERDRDPEWNDREVRVLTYASDQTRSLYFEWDRALLRLAGVVQPQRVTGASRPDDLPSVIEAALATVRLAGTRLLEQIRSELRSGS